MAEAALSLLRASQTCGTIREGRPKGQPSTAARTHLEAGHGPRGHGTTHANAPRPPPRAIPPTRSPPPRQLPPASCQLYTLHAGLGVDGGDGGSLLVADGLALGADLLEDAVLLDVAVDAGHGAAEGVRGVLGELDLGDSVELHDVGAVGDAEGADAGPHVREGTVLGDAVGTVDLHGLVEDLERALRGGDLDHGHILACLLEATVVGDGGV